MDLTNLESARLLPGWMRSQLDDVALTRAVDRTGGDVYEASRLLSLWDRIDELPEGVIDELAWALHIDWFDYGAPLDVKRALVKESDFVHSRKGTVAAVESVIRAYFGSGEVEEWFDYGGEPYHFRVRVADPSLIGDNLVRFLDNLDKVKRYSTVLDEILVTLEGDTDLHLGATVIDAAHERCAVAMD